MQNINRGVKIWKFERVIYKIIILYRVFESFKGGTLPNFFTQWAKSPKKQYV